MKQQIRILLPNYGITTALVEYHANVVGSKRLYTIDGVQQTYRGDPIGKPLDVEAVISMNGYETMEKMLVEASQGGYRKGIELDNKHLPNPCNGVQFKQKIIRKK